MMFTFIQVHHIRGRKLIRTFKVSTPCKKVVKTMRYKQMNYTARTILKSDKLKNAAFKEISSLLHHEAKNLCKLQSSSVLRVTSARSVSTFTWQRVINDFKKYAPTLYQLLCAVVSAGEITRSANIKVLTAASILLVARCRHMCMIQTLVGLTLYAGHAAKKV